MKKVFSLLALSLIIVPAICSSTKFEPGYEYAVFARAYNAPGGTLGDDELVGSYKIGRFFSNLDPEAKKNKNDIEVVAPVTFVIYKVKSNEELAILAKSAGFSTDNPVVSQTDKDGAIFFELKPGFRLFFKKNQKTGKIIGMFDLNKSTFFTTDEDRAAGRYDIRTYFALPHGRTK